MSQYVNYLITLIITEFYQVDSYKQVIGGNSIAVKLFTMC
jgi:hypothetical protein